MWKNISLVLLVFLLLSSPICLAEVVLTDQEWEELNLIWTELEKLLDEQSQELEFQEIQLSAADQEISELEKSLKKVELSLKKQEKEQTRKKIIWAISGLVIGGFLGVILE